MAQRFRQITYGEQIDSAACEVARLTEINSRTGRRASDLQDARGIVRRIVEQMRATGKRRSSCFYGLIDPA